MYSIGHSNHELDKFQDLLHEHKITAIADVRSVPVSKFSPHYNKNELKLSLEYIRVSYVFLGKELGGRPSSYKYFSGSKADYEKMRDWNTALPQSKVFDAAFYIPQTKPECSSSDNWARVEKF